MLVRLGVCVLLWVSVLEAAKKTSRVKEYEDTVEEPSTLLIEHSFGSREEFHKRGVVSLKGLKSSSVSFVQEPLTNPQIQTLRSLALTGGYYYLQAQPMTSGAREGEGEGEGGVSTCISACALVSAALSDSILITTDGRGAVGLAVTSSPSSGEGLDCNDLNVKLPSIFNTSLSVSTGSAGPIPEVQSFLQKLEKEEKEKLEGKDNRTFFQKYWMYLLLGGLALYTLVGSAGGGGGGGQ